MTALSGQSFSKSEWEIISLAILDEHAEVIRLRTDAVTDSIAYQDLLTAFYFKDSSLQQSQKATADAQRIGNDFLALGSITEEQLAKAKKDLRKQKALKWLGFGLAGLSVILFAR